MADINKKAQIEVTVKGSEQAKAQLSGIAGSMKSLGATVVGALGLMQGFRMLGQVLAKSYAEAEESRIAHEKLSVMLRNSGKAAEISAKQLEDHAQALSNISNFDDEDILMGVTSNLLKFKNISSSVFKQATTSIVDLAQAMGGGDGSLETATKKIGMALQRPAEGLARLRKEGVDLRPELESVVKSLVSMGRTTEAQTIILKELDATIGGVAFAMQSSSKKMTNSWNNMLEAMGKTGAINTAKLALSSFFNSVTANIITASAGIEGQAERQQIVAARIGIYARAVLTMISGVVATVFDAFRVVGVQFAQIGKNIIETIGAIITAPKRILAGENVLQVLKSIPNAWADTFTDAGSIITANIKNWTSTFSNLRGEISASDKQIAELYANMRKSGGQIDLSGFDTSTGADATASTGAVNDYARALQDLTDDIARYTQQTAASASSGNAFIDSLAAQSKAADDLRERIYAMFDDTPERADLLMQIANAQTQDLVEIYTKYYTDTTEMLKQSIRTETEIIEADYQKRLTDFDAYAQNIRIALDGLLVNKVMSEQEYNAALLQLTTLGTQIQAMALDERAKKLQEYNDKHQAVVTEAAVKELSAMEQLGQDLQDSVVNGFSTAFASALVDGDNFAKSMQKLFKDMVRMLLIELAKLAILNLFTGATAGAGSGILGGLFGKSATTTNSGYSAAPPTYLTPVLSTSSLEARIDRLASKIENNQPIVYTQVIEGVPFANAVDRAYLKRNAL